MESDAAPPEAVLIKEAREARRPKLSQTAAAKKIGLSGTRWRQIESGYQTPSAGVRNRVVAPADTLAAMARVVGVTEDQLKAVGRHDAAKELATLTKRTIGRGLASLIPADDDAASPHSEYFQRAERLLHHAHNSFRHGDYLGTIHGLEGAQSTVELLIDRVTETALEESSSSHVVETSSEPPAPETGDKNQEVKSQQPEVGTVDEPPVGDIMGSEIPSEDAGENRPDEGDQAQQL